MVIGDRPRGRNIIGWGALLGVVMAFCLWQMAHLGGFRWDYDEGAHMMQARLMLMGYPLYAETFSGQPPLLISSLAGASKPLASSACPDAIHPTSKLLRKFISQFPKRYSYILKSQ